MLSIILIYICQYRNARVGLYYISILPIILVAALRDPSIGVDTSYYVLDYFNTSYYAKSLLVAIEDIGVEELYISLNYLVSRFTKDFNIYLFFAHSLMYGSVITALIMLKKELWVWIGCWFLCFFFFRDSLNIARQSIAISILMISFALMIKNKIFLSAFFICLSFGFHHTAIIFFFVLFLKIIVTKNSKLLNKKLFKFSVLVIIGVVLYFFAVVANYMESLGIMPEKYVERYASDDSFGASLPIAQFSLCIVNLLVLYTIKIKNKYKSDSLLILFEYILLISLISCFAGLISTLAIRIGDYFAYMSVIIFPLLYSKYKCNGIVRNLHLLFLVFYWFMTVIVANLSETYPYKSIF